MRLMFASPYHLKTYAMRRAVACSLMLWLSGAVCLFGCVPGGASAASAKDAGIAQRIIASDDGVTVASASGHVCCNIATKNRGARPVEALSGSTSAMQCCPFVGQAACAVRKLPLVNQLLSDVAQTKWSASLNSTTRETVPASGRTHLPDARGAYLRYCVFLI